VNNVNRTEAVLFRDESKSRFASRTLTERRGHFFRVGETFARTSIRVFFFFSTLLNYIIITIFVVIIVAVVFKPTEKRFEYRRAVFVLSS
jgi:hypothetical protein